MLAGLSTAGLKKPDYPVGLAGSRPGSKLPFAYLVDSA